MPAGSEGRRCPHKAQQLQQGRGASVNLESEGRGGSLCLCQPQCQQESRSLMQGPTGGQGAPTLKPIPLWIHFKDQRLRQYGAKEQRANQEKGEKQQRREKERKKSVPHTIQENHINIRLAVRPSSEPDREPEESDQRAEIDKSNHFTRTRD
ncbi:hypothetical protein JZ751_024834 [Albula glossodonta]|uniref:Uncharacterized protein n=1 Tax=Albula glossodonta TaxID=121402 RepID=A0A8T2PEJ1_9TELE|nr:hypothetical protein JZ751_024834 [Albula glossodonta]